MKNYSPADMAIKNMLDGMSHNGSTFPSTEALMKEIGAIIDQYGADDEDLVCIPLSRYDELLRSESEIDILCTLVESPHVESKTALAALESVADMRDKRLNDCEDDTDEESRLTTSPQPCCKEACLMENNRKDPRRQLIGAVSKALGQQFERDINAAYDHYRRLGVASIEKTPEPFHMTGRENGGKVVGFYEKKAQPDYAGTLRGGRSVYMEAKFTGSNRMEQSRVSPGQTEYLDEKMRVGAFCYVLAGFSHGGAYCIPWSVWRSMKEHYGRKYITENDITQYKIPRTTTGMLAILGTGKE